MATMKFRDISGFRKVACIMCICVCIRVVSMIVLSITS